MTKTFDWITKARRRLPNSEIGRSLEIIMEQMTHVERNALQRDEMQNNRLKALEQRMAALEDRVDAMGRREQKRAKRFWFWR